MPDDVLKPFPAEAATGGADDEGVDEAEDVDLDTEPTAMDWLGAINESHCRDAEFIRAVGDRVMGYAFATLDPGETEGSPQLHDQARQSAIETIAACRDLIKSRLSESKRYRAHLFALAVGAREGDG